MHSTRVHQLAAPTGNILMDYQRQHLFYNDEAYSKCGLITGSVDFYERCPSCHVRQDNEYNVAGSIT